MYPEVHNMNNEVKKIYVCPFCSAKLNEQEGFDEKKKDMKCLYCGNVVSLNKEEDIVKDVKSLVKKARPIVEFGTGLALIALGTAVSAAEYVIEKRSGSTLKKNEPEKTKVDPNIEDKDRNII